MNDSPKLLLKRLIQGKVMVRMPLGHYVHTYSKRCTFRIVPSML